MMLMLLAEEGVDDAGFGLFWRETESHEFSELVARDFAAGDTE